MKYRLFENSGNDTDNILKTVFKNRNIEDYMTYLTLTDDVIIDYNKLDNISDALKCFKTHYEKKNKISILCDNDTDGLCSSAMMYWYVKQLDSDYPIELIVHRKNKSHGLNDRDFAIPEGTKLIIVPDAGTNDTDACQELKKKGIDIIILDHHQKEVANPFAIVVNNQVSKEYSNKQFSGAGVVYKFLQALDDEFWVECADNCLDLCAIANIADSMDITSFETKRIIEKGFADVHNEFLLALINVQRYGTNEKISIHNVSWGIAPLINALIRVGSFEERELLFKAAAGIYEEFEYKKRATKSKPSEVVFEDIYDRAARLAKNAKSRQDKMRKSGLAEIINYVGDLTDDDKVVICDATDFIKEGLTGITAIKVAEYYKRPCIILTKREENTDVYSGSMRNFDNSPIENFQSIINSCPSFNSCMGHPNAAGVDLNIDKLESAKSELNNILKDIQYDNVYDVDFIIQSDNISCDIVRQIANLSEYVGKGFPSPLIACEFSFNLKDAEIIGKANNTLRYYLNDVPFYFFGIDKSELEICLNDWGNNLKIIIEIVGEPRINEYQGLKELQVVVKDFNLINIDKNDINNCTDEEEEAW